MSNHPPTGSRPAHFATGLRCDYLLDRVRLRPRGAQGPHAGNGPEGVYPDHRSGLSGDHNPRSANSPVQRQCDVSVLFPLLVFRKEVLVKIIKERIVSFNAKLGRARSRLYRSQFLQLNNKYSLEFESSWDLQDLHVFAPLRPQYFRKLSSNFFAFFGKILQKFAIFQFFFIDFCSDFYEILSEFRR